MARPNCRTNDESKAYSSRNRSWAILIYEHLFCLTRQLTRYVNCRVHDKDSKQVHTRITKICKTYSLTGLCGCHFNTKIQLTTYSDYATGWSTEENGFDFRTKHRFLVYTGIQTGSAAYRAICHQMKLARNIVYEYKCT
jgi:hypothetical protein